MQLLLVQNFSYLYRRGGAHKANRILLEELAARGHVCHVVAPASTEPGARRGADFLATLAARGIAPAVEHDVIRFADRGVEVHAIAGDDRGPVWRADGLRDYLARITPELDPDWIIVVDDYAGLLVKSALDLVPERVVYLAHTPVALPFGPASYVPQPETTERLRKCAGILTVSNYMKDYLQRWGGLDATVLRFPVYGPGPFPRLGHFDRGLVTFVNPSAIKGLSIFLALARAFPDVAFGAVPTWGMTAAEDAQLRELSNVHLLPATDDIDDIFAQTRVLLVPSLWGEAFGQIVMESMLRGIPVLASNSGGLPETKLGVDYVLPVRMIERYERQFNESTGPVPVIEPQELGPWEHALREVISSRDHYDHLARASRAAAHAFVAELGIAPFERYLAELPRVSPPGRTPEPAASPTAGSVPKAAPSAADRRSLLALRLRNKQPRSGKAPFVPRRPAAEPIPLSFAQQRLWFLEQLNPGQPNNHVAIHFAGPLDLAVVQRCLTEIVRRHEVLRTIFPELDGQPVQQIHPAAEVPLPRHSLLHLPASEREAHARRAVAEAIRERIDLRRGPVLRACVFQLGEDEHVLVIVMHHIASDGWSAGILVRELSALYRAFAAGQPSPLPELEIQYADFAHWQRTQRHEVLAEQLAYWPHKLAGMPAVSELLTDYPRPSIQTYRGAQQGIALNAELVSGIRELGQREGATVFMTLLAMFQALLARYTGQLDLAVGTPVASRTRIEIEPLLGSFVNMLVMRVDLSDGPTFRELLRQVRKTVVEAFANQEVPFEMVVEALRPERDLSRNPLFQIAFVVQSATVAEPELPRLRARPFEIARETVNFDLSLAVWERPDGLQLYFDYNTDLFAPATIARMLEHLHNLLRAAVNDPDRSVFTPPVLSEAECEQVVRGWNATAAAYPPERCIHRLFEEQAARTPEALALVCGDSRLSYRELDAAANRVAHGLRARGVGPDVVVGLFMERSVEMVVGLFGILKAGGAYVPLDPGYPPSRLAYMREDSGCRLVLSQEALLGRLGRLEMGDGREVLALDGEAWLRERAGHGDTAPEVAGLTSRHLAYVIYTSGSTGQPKGVMIEHRGVVNLFLSIHRMIGLSSVDRWLATTSMSFDIAALELYSSLIAGAAVVLATGTQARDPAWLSAEIAAAGATVMQSTPALWSVLLEQPGWAPPAGFRMLCGGEALGPGLHARLTEEAGRAWNVYGPTETTIWSSAAEVRKDERISIGAGLANTQLYVLDGQREPLPVGVVGELYIGGVGVARGYLNKPELTAERFVADPFSGDPEARLYRTGDLARWLPAGTLEYVGRIDTQVKIRGYRIELGEIEAVLARAPGVREAVVVALAEGMEGEGKRLVAYVVPAGREGGPEGGPEGGGVDESGRGVRVAGYRQHLQEQLPGYMVPELYVELAGMPLTGNGKVDRKALPAPADSDLDRAAYVAPRTETESRLVALWQSVLKLPRVGVEDNFFALGGHSLLATRLVSLVRKELGVEVPLRSLFERPTVAGFADALQALSGEAAVLPPIQRVERDRDEATLVAAVTGKRKARKTLI